MTNVVRTIKGNCVNIKDIKDVVKKKKFALLFVELYNATQAQLAFTQKPPFALAV